MFTIIYVFITNLTAVSSAINIEPNTINKNVSISYCQLENIEASQ